MRPWHEPASENLTAPLALNLTANGVSNAYLVDLSSVQVGDIQLRNIKGVVVDGGPEKLHQTLLGMSFLNHLEMRRSGNTLTLVRR